MKTNYEVLKDAFKALDEIDNDDVKVEHLQENLNGTFRHKASLKESPVMRPRFDSRNSFYGKANIKTSKDGGKLLISYSTPVVKITRGGEVELGPSWNYSPTTLRHVKEFLKQNGFKADTSKQIERDYKVNFSIRDEVYDRNESLKECGDKTADELAYERYKKGEYTYQDYVDVCELEECEPLPKLNEDKGEESNIKKVFDKIGSKKCYIISKNPSDSFLAKYNLDKYKHQQGYWNKKDDGISYILDDINLDRAKEIASALHQDAFIEVNFSNGGDSIEAKMFNANKNFSNYTPSTGVATDVLIGDDAISQLGYSVIGDFAYSFKFDESLSSNASKCCEDYEDLEIDFPEIAKHLADECNKIFPDAHITSDDIEFDDSRAWCLYVSGRKLGLNCNKFGAYRPYEGGGVRGPIQHNGRTQDNTVELGKEFAKSLEKVETSLNRGSEDEEEWNKPSGVLLKEDVNEGELSKFIREAVDGLKKTNIGTWFKELGNGLYVVIGFSGGYGREKRDDVIQASDDLDYAICAKVAYNCDDLQMDYDVDWSMPVDDETGDIWDSEISIEPCDIEDNYRSLSKWLIQNYKQMSKAIDDGKLICESKKKDFNKVVESVSVDLNDEKSVKEGKNVLNNAKDASEEKIVDVDANTVDELKDAYVGQTILRCPVCRTLIYREPSKLNKSDDGDVYNVDEECPHCGSADGFELVGQVASVHGSDSQHEQANEPTNIKEEPTNDESGIDMNSGDTNSADDESNINMDISGDDNSLNEEPNINLESFETKSFDGVASKYMKSIYEDVNSYKTTNVSIDNDKLVVEGKIIFNDNTAKDTKFTFNSVNGKYYRGMNETFSKQKNAFKLKTSIKNGCLVSESLNYKYNQGNNLIEGKVRN